VLVFSVLYWVVFKVKPRADLRFILLLLLLLL
jgi:hypothetical protein